MLSKKFYLQTTHRILQLLKKFDFFWKKERINKISSKVKNTCTADVRKNISR